MEHGGCSDVPRQIVGPAGRIPPPNRPKTGPLSRPARCSRPWLLHWTRLRIPNRLYDLLRSARCRLREGVTRGRCNDRSTASYSMSHSLTRAP